MPIIDHLKSIGKIHKKFTGEFGIEIETESKKEYLPPNFTYWSHHGDGSLRDYGIEYILKQPVQYYQEVKAALEEFRDKTKDIKFIKDSVTTSVHVHVNMLNETWRTLGNFLTLYTLFENLLIRYSGPDRLSNLFCLPICDAEETYKTMVLMFDCIQRKNYKGLAINENSVKYAACNLSALYKYGSVEIRSFRGETDIERIQNWVSILYQMLDFARQDINPKTVILSWKDRQKEFLNDVFKDYRKEIAHADELKLIDQNVWYAASVAYSVKNWEALDVIEKTPDFKPKQKDLENGAQAMFGIPWAQLTLQDQMHVTHILQMQHNQKHGIANPGLGNIPAPMEAPPAPPGRARPRAADIAANLAMANAAVAGAGNHELRAGVGNAQQLRAQDWWNEGPVVAPQPAVNPIEWQRLARQVLNQRVDRNNEERERDA